MVAYDETDQQTYDDNEIDRLTRELDDTQNKLDNAHMQINRLTEQLDAANSELSSSQALLAERDSKLTKLVQDFNLAIKENTTLRAEVEYLTYRGSDDARGRLDAEHAMRHQRFELERLKEESSHLWVRIESGEAAAYEQGKAEARKQAAQEIVGMLRADRWAESELKEIIEKFGLEG